jgi:hypothetical protein
MNTNTQTTASPQAGLTLKAYRGDGSVMLAFDHYHFRAIQNQASQTNPLQLQRIQLAVRSGGARITTLRILSTMNVCFSFDKRPS